MKPFIVRCFEYHDGPSPYNPAAIYELDHEVTSAPAVGDYLQCSDHKVYVVKERFFDIGRDSIARCALIVKEVDMRFPEG